MFIVGLPNQLRRRVEAEARRRERYVFAVYAGFGPKGTLRLLPIDSDAVHSFRHYMDRLNSYEDAHVLVLPYTSIPRDLEEELQTVKSLGGLIVRPNLDSADLPVLVKRPDTTFYNSVFDFITQQLAPESDAQGPPSEHFKRLAEENPRLLITKGALASCDEVPQYRWHFLTKAADVFELLLRENGAAGSRLDAFFREHGLHHAQSGGINTTLQVFKDGKCVHDNSSNMHLKQGDGTTSIAAARIYYQVFSYEGNFYVAILHAGPHPDRDITRRCML